MAMALHGSLRTTRQIGPDKKGTALLEFAITLPVLLMLYLGLRRRRSLSQNDDHDTHDR